MNLTRELSGWTLNALIDRVRQPSTPPSQFAEFARVLDELIERHAISFIHVARTRGSA